MPKDKKNDSDNPLNILAFAASSKRKAYKRPKPLLSDSILEELIHHLLLSFAKIELNIHQNNPRHEKNDVYTANCKLNLKVRRTDVEQEWILPLEVTLKRLHAKTQIPTLHATALEVLTKIGLAENYNNQACKYEFVTTALSYNLIDYNYRLVSQSPVQLIPDRLPGPSQALFPKQDNKKRRIEIDLTNSDPDLSESDDDVSAQRSVKKSKK